MRGYRAYQRFVKSISEYKKIRESLLTIFSPLDDAVEKKTLSVEEVEKLRNKLLIDQKKLSGKLSELSNYLLLQKFVLRIEKRRVQNQITIEQAMIKGSEVELAKFKGNDLETFNLITGVKRESLSDIDKENLQKCKANHETTVKDLVKSIKTLKQLLVKLQRYNDNIEKLCLSTFNPLSEMCRPLSEVVA
jgi:hypothetical protein